MSNKQNDKIIDMMVDVVDNCTCTYKQALKYISKEGLIHNANCYESNSKKNNRNKGNVHIS